MSEVKSAILGESFGKAVHKLRKSILFDLVKKLGLDNCYRCTLKIENIDNLSIEHKIAWQSAEDPINTFYGLDNIAFSHLKCNYGARKSPSRNLVHGTKTGYNYGCRCDSCRKAMSAKKAEWRAKAKS